jgi:pimeloyl-ACP methyl ester carboxylesterase
VFNSIRVTAEMMDMSSTRRRRFGRTVALPDGRRIGVAEYGDPSGNPVLYCHGFPSSRLEPAMVDITSIRLIALDRPGYGLSDPLPGRTLTDWPNDVAAVADALGLDRFAMAGVSGGAPYAAACAALLSRRVTGLIIISGVAPPGHGWETGGAAENLMIMNRLPGSAALAARLGRRLVLTLPPADLLKALLLFGKLPEPDRAVLETGIGVPVLEGFREGLGRGIEGAVADARVYAQPWGFDPGVIDVPTVIWHGTLDNQVPVAAAHTYGRLIPQSKVCIVEGEGHFSLVVRHHIPILSSLLTVAEQYGESDVTPGLSAFPGTGF